MDQPASQASKRTLLEAAGIAVPANVVLVPIDFEHQNLRDGLATHGFDPAALTFVSCLGVLVYMSLAAVTELFRYIATLPPGSECVFTFGGKSTGPADGELSLAAMAAAVGEPWQSSLDIGELRELLTSVGLPPPSLLTGEQAAQYLGERKDGLAVPTRERIASVIVGEVVSGLVP